MKREHGGVVAKLLSFVKGFNSNGTNTKHKMVKTLKVQNASNAEQNIRMSPVRNRLLISLVQLE